VERGLGDSTCEQNLPELPPDAVPLGRLLTTPLLFLPDLDLIGGGFGQRDDLLHIDKQATVVVIGLHADAADVETVLVEPYDGGGQLLRELRRGQDDADVLGEYILVGVFPA
jgi:hypothetical protein